MIDFLIGIDTQIFLFFNSLHAPWADVFFYWVSHRLVWIPLYIAILWGLIRKFRKQSWLPILLMVLAITCSDQTCNIVKRSVQRVRPSHNKELESRVHLVETPDGKVYRGGQFSFPSSHAANSIVVAFFVAFLLATRRKSIIYAIFFWSLLLGYSRIYLGVHYLSDLLVGYAIGAVFSLLFLQFLPVKISRIRKVYRDTR